MRDTRVHDRALYDKCVGLGCHGLAPWSAHVGSYEEQPPNSLWMPWACPMEAHVSSYEERPPNSLWMPWACPMEAHADDFACTQAVRQHRENSTGQARGI